MKFLKNYRFELSFKNITDLENKLNFCRVNEINKINIPCKGLIKKQIFNDTFEYLNNNYEGFDVFYHYSLFHQYEKDKKISYKNLLDFINKCKSNKKNNILLISGSNKKKNFDVIDVLNDLKNEKNLISNFGIAFNPYLEKYYGVSKERERLEKKISSGLIKSIWLQFGTDINLLEREIKFIKNMNNEKINLILFGSLLIPSKQFIARFKFRPWKEVYISPNYLDSLEKFYSFTKDLIDFYDDNNIYPFIETEVTTAKNFKNFYSLINK